MRAKHCFFSMVLTFIATAMPNFGLAQTNAPENKQITIAMGGKNLYYLPLTIAERLGYFKEEGLQATIVDFPGGAKAAQAMLGGSADVASGSYEYTINMQAKGVPIVAIVLLGRYSGMVLAIAKSRAAQYKSPKDLKGMKVGVTSPGSSTNMFVNNLLVKNGLKPDDVSIIGVGTTAAAVAAIKQNSIDVLVNLDPVISKLESDGDIVIAADARNAKGMQEAYGGAYLAGCLLVKSNYLSKNPNTVQAMTNAIVHALRWIAKATPDQITEAVGPDYYGDDKALYKLGLSKNIESFLHDGTFSMQGAENVYKVLNTFEPSVREAKIDLTKTYTNTFVQNALRKYK
jgi:NitT/TauT family transport system substrate-binding protein